jgi:hypothetical protein
MKVLLFALALALIELTVLWVREASVRLRERGSHRSTWRVASYSDAGRTTVAVRLVNPSGAVLDEHVIARVPGDAIDWHRSLLQAQLEAESRAMHLNGRS